MTMAKLTYPIDKKDFHEIDDLKHIIHEFPGMDSQLRFVCYRFDPLCVEVKKRSTVSEKDEMAAMLSGYKPRMEDMVVIRQMTTHFLRQINSLDWEIMCTLEIAMDQSMQIIREDIAGLDMDQQLKAMDLKQKVINGIGKTEDMLVTKKQIIIAGDESAAKAVAESSKERMKTRSTLTGAPISE